MKELAKLVQEGKFDHIGLSEVAADTLRRAHAVHPVSVVEIEVSPWSYEDNAKEGKLYPAHVVPLPNTPSYRRGERVGRRSRCIFVRSVTVPSFAKSVDRCVDL